MATPIARPSAPTSCDPACEQRKHLLERIGIATLIGIVVWFTVAYVLFHR